MRFVNLLYNRSGVMVIRALKKQIRRRLNEQGPIQDNSPLPPAPTGVENFQVPSLEGRKRVIVAPAAHKVETIR